MGDSELSRAASALGVREDATRRAVLNALAQRPPAPARWRVAVAVGVAVLGTVAAAAVAIRRPEPAPPAAPVVARVAPAAPAVRAVAAEPEPVPKPKPRVAVVAPLPPLATWRHARALRAAGRSAEALAELAKLEAAGDATWAPLALLESARLLAASEGEDARALAATRRFLSQYPRHELVVEARALERELTRAP